MFLQFLYYFYSVADSFYTTQVLSFYSVGDTAYLVFIYFIFFTNPSELKVLMYVMMELAGLSILCTSFFFPLECRLQVLASKLASLEQVIPVHLRNKKKPIFLVPNFNFLGSWVISFEELYIF